MHSIHPPWASFTSLHRTSHQMTSYVHSTFVYHVPPTSMELHASRAHVESDTQVNSKCRCMSCVQEDITWTHCKYLMRKCTLLGAKA